MANHTAAGSTADNGVSYEQASSYFSGRVLTLGGVILFFVGLCCIFAVLFRFTRHSGRRIPVQVVEPEKPRVLNQDTINYNFPIRIWPSQDRIIVDKHDRVIGFFAGFKAREPIDRPENNDDEEEVDEEETNSRLKEERSRKKPLLRRFGFMERLYHRHNAQSTTSRDSDGNGSSSAVMEVNIPLDNMDTKSLLDCPIGSHIENQESQLEKEELAEQIEEQCCSICISEYEENDRVRILPCNHEFHAECIGK
ncbi:hypothetical protein BGZ76_000084 [Entomortierella beljakovae]|nr:hypothetical protein BGZ76_000084 [Entomortierella beljakovae]